MTKSTSTTIHLGDRFEGGIYVGRSIDRAYRLVLSPRIVTNEPLTFNDAVLRAQGYHQGDVRDWEIPSHEDFLAIIKNFQAKGMPLDKVFSKTTRTYWTSTIEGTTVKGYNITPNFNNTIDLIKRHKVFLRLIRRIPVPVKVSKPLNLEEIQALQDRVKYLESVLQANHILY